MKLITSLLITFCAFNYYSQTSQFSENNDVMTFVIGKTYSDNDGTTKITFGTSDVNVEIEANNFKMKYDGFSIISSTMGLIKLTELSSGRYFEIYVSENRVKLKPDNIVLFESTGKDETSVKTNDFSFKIIKVGGLEVINHDLGSFSWENAKNKTDSYNSWRLPTLEDMTLIMQNADMFSILGTYEWWWTSDVYSENEMQVVSFKYATYLPSEVNQKHGLLLVRKY